MSVRGADPPGGPRSRVRMPPGRWIGLTLGLVGLVLVAFVDNPLHHQEPHGRRMAAAAGVTLLMAVWWLTEALPITWTACVPLLAFPLLRVFADAPAANVLPTLKPYFDPYIFLFAGGMGIAAAMQQWNLHRRIALTIMRAVGTAPARLLLGMLAATAFISMWISNTATAALMMPIGLAVIREIEVQHGGARLHHFGAALMLAVAYAANLGGIGTKIGTAPNAMLAQFLTERGTDVGFLVFFAVGAPFVALFLPVVWWRLWSVGRKDAPAGRAGADVIEAELRRLGPIQPAEKVVLVVFAVTALLWVAGKPLTDVLRPHVTAFRLTGGHLEGGVAMAAMATLMLLRAQGRAVLELRQLRHVPWDTLLLLGGAFCMAEAVQHTGLSAWMAGQVGFLRTQPFLAQVLLASAITVFLSAFASNTATISVMLNVLWSAVHASQAPAVLFAATVAASCDFALPAGTPPNAIVFGSGYVSVRRMAATGAVLDLLAAALCGSWCALVVPVLLGSG